jgi:hypothetical protein
MPLPAARLCAFVSDCAPVTGIGVMASVRPVGESPCSGGIVASSDTLDHHSGA